MDDTPLPFSSIYLIKVMLRILKSYFESFMNTVDHVKLRFYQS